MAALQRRPGVTSQLATFAGLGYRAAVPALLMTVFLLSLTGIPPLAGFFAKAMVVLSALEVGGNMTLLAVIMMLNAAMAAFYYLRVVVYMYMRQPADDAAPVSIGWYTHVGLWLAAAATILIGLFPAVTGAQVQLPMRRDRAGTGLVWGPPRPPWAPMSSSKAAISPVSGVEYRLMTASVADNARCRRGARSAADAVVAVRRPSGPRPRRAPRST